MILLCSLTIHFVLLRVILQLLCLWISILVKKTFSVLVIIIVRYDTGVSTMVAVLEFSRYAIWCWSSWKDAIYWILFLIVIFRYTDFFWIFCQCQSGATQMRFQPRLGRILAAAVENYISILDVETQVCRLKLQVSYS